MDKMQMAHDMALELVKIKPSLSAWQIADRCFEYADAMQSEAEKRNKAEAAQKRKEIREMLNAPNTFIEREGQHFDDVEEWQPDWSQAPEWANYIAVYSDYCNAGYFEKEPKIISGYTWGGADGKSLLTPIPVYTGNWKESLRKRPEALFEVDWSQAPKTAIAWKMQSKSNAVWVHNKSLSAFEYSIAPSFNYQGNWQDSLRKRPQ